MDRESRSELINPRAAVIGASGGIGRAFVDALLDRGYTVHALSRSRPAGLPERVEWTSIDLTSENTIEEAAEKLGELNLVIIASGILHENDLQPEKDWQHLDPEQMRKVFEVNTFGPALVIKHFAPLLPKKGRGVIAALSARVGSISDNRLGGWYTYRASKAALNQIIKTASIELARKRKNAAIIGLHPGTVETPLSEPFRNNQFERFSPRRSAGYLMTVIEKSGPQSSGRCFDWKGEEVPA